MIDLLTQKSGRSSSTTSIPISNFMTLSMSPIIKFSIHGQMSRYQHKNGRRSRCATEHLETYDKFIKAFRSSL